ncbi:kda protein in nof-fb transposable element [Lasius niger]|uniref:KDa protein in nof-fb transposable element n=2 Tax=Lasius TaxID=488720 RepID=A0A0J7KX57_LASNI|nr:kda protein in nof-fb transposable element [Lasius niger]
MTEPSDDKNLTSTNRWIKTLINMVKPKDLKKTGTEINGFYLPNFVDQIERITKEFPLWTAAIVPNKKRHASTAYMERYFADLKDKVFKDFPKPTTMNCFLKVHVDDLIGAANLFQF